MRCVAALVAALALASPALAASAADVRRLATAAVAGDAAALTELRALREVDGRPVDLGRALDASGPVLDARLERLATATLPASTEAPREIARAILEDGVYHAGEPPRPLRRPLRWLGEQLRRIVAPLEPYVPDSTLLRALLAAALLALLATVAAVLLGRRRLLSAEQAADRERQAADPAALERAADEALARGDLEAALRLRYEAGLVRLHRAKRIVLRSSTTSGEVRAALAEPTFDELATTHDDVVYGARPAGRDDVERAVDGWRRVLTR